MSLGAVPGTGRTLATGHAALRTTVKGQGAAVEKWWRNSKAPPHASLEGAEALMAANFNKRRGLYISSSDETDQNWQDFHQQLSTQAVSQPEPEDDFPQLELQQRGNRSPSKEPVMEPSSVPSRPLPPGKPLPQKPVPKSRPPSSSVSAPSPSAPVQPPSDDPLGAMNPRTKSPMRPQGIRANGTTLPSLAHRARSISRQLLIL